MEHGSRSKTRFCAVFAAFAASANIAWADDLSTSVAPNSPNVSVWDSTGGTTVAVNDSEATITVHIDFCCRAQDAAGPGGNVAANPSENYILDMVKAAQKMWNDALAQYLAKDCLKIKTAFDAKFVEDQQHWDPGYHRILAHYTAANSGSKDPDSKTRWDDTDTVYGQAVGGEFFFGTGDYGPAMTPTILAHEIGHLMGLGDDYLTAHSAIAGRCGTLMSDSKNGTIDQQLAPQMLSPTAAQTMVFELAGQHDFGKFSVKFHPKEWSPPGGIDTTGFSTLLVGYPLGSRTIEIPVKSETQAGGPFVVEWPHPSNRRSATGQISLKCTSCKPNDRSWPSSDGKPLVDVVSKCP